MMEIVASLLAAMSAASIVWALFYPVNSAGAHATRRLATLVATRKAQDHTETRRSIARVQQAALKAVAENAHARRASRLDAHLAAAGVRLTRTGFVICCALLGTTALLAALVAGLPLLLALAMAVLAGWLLPLRVLAMLAARRRAKFLTAFTPAVDMILRGTKSGLAVADCLNIVAEDADALIRAEFAAVAAQLRAGIPLPEAMERLSTAMPLPEVRFFVLIMAMQSQTGGNLSVALGNLANVLRDRQRLAAKVRTASSEARASAIAIGLLVPAFVGATMVMAPDYIRVLWTTDTGRTVLSYSAVWLALGIYVLKRVARIEP